MAHPALGKRLIEKSCDISERNRVPILHCRHFNDLPVDQFDTMPFKKSKLCHLIIHFARDAIRLRHIRGLAKQRCHASNHSKSLLWLGVEPVLKDARGGEGINPCAFLEAGVVAGKFGFGIVAGEVLVDAVDGDLGADGLGEREDEAFSEFGLVGDVAIGEEGKTDDDGFDGFALDEPSDGLGELGVGEVFEDFEREGEAGVGIADGDAGAFESVVDANGAHESIVRLGFRECLGLGARV